MSGKSRTLAVAAATVGLIGLWAPMAMASTAGDHASINGGLVNVSHNQVPVQVCNDNIPVNVIGIQVPLNGIAAALGLLSSGNTASHSNTSCHQGAAQDAQDAQAAAWTPGTPGTGCTSCDADSAWGWGTHDDHANENGGLVNISHNQVPLQLCNDNVPVNVIGGQVPVSDLAAALGLLSSGNTSAAQDSSCHQGSAQG
jgi:predicted CxxxxCH...CXXCH cytochrome family protein